MQDSYLYTDLLPCILGAALIRFIPGKWAGRPLYPSAGDGKRQSRTVLWVLAVIFAVSTLLLVLFGRSSGEAAPQQFGWEDVVGQTLVWAILLLPLLAGMIRSGLGWRDLQFRRAHLAASFVMGTLVGVMFLFGAGKAAGLTTLFAAGGLFATLQFLVVGFAEEMLFRGYVQVRWVAALGWWRGWLLASVVMSLFHVPILFLSDGLPFFGVLMGVLRLIPPSLLLGYSLRRSGNIVAPAVIHLWMNLVLSL